MGPHGILSCTYVSEKDIANVEPTAAALLTINKNKRRHCLLGPCLLDAQGQIDLIVVTRAHLR